MSDLDDELDNARTGGVMVRDDNFPDSPLLSSLLVDMVIGAFLLLEHHTGNSDLVK